MSKKQCPKKSRKQDNICINLRKGCIWLAISHGKCWSWGEACCSGSLTIWASLVLPFHNSLLRVVHALGKDRKEVDCTKGKHTSPKTGNTAHDGLEFFGRCETLLRHLAFLLLHL